MEVSMLNRVRNLLVPFGNREIEEVAEGVFETRRQLLMLPVAIAAVMLLDRPLSRAQTVASSVWDEFLKESLPRALELHQDATREGQEKYLRWLGFSASNLKLSDLPTAKLGKFKDLEPASYFGVGYRGKPFFIVEWRMEPNAYLPPHNHPNVSVCTFGLAGEAQIRNFEPVGPLPEFSSKKMFKVRETHNEVLRLGRINSLSARRDNIHTFQAGKEGARGIDITTFHGENVGFSHLDIAERSRDSNERVFDAVWKKL
jgi:hypothetical protein